MADHQLRAGEKVTLRWQGVPRDAEEMEILLSVDGGRHFPIRVSAEMDPRTGEYVWRVPNLPTHEAALRMRFGDEHEEHETPPTALFEIVGDEGKPAELKQVHEGGWWEGVDADEAPAPASDMRAGEGTTLATSRGTRVAAEASRPTLGTPRSVSRMSGDVVTNMHFTSEPTRGLPGTARSVPMRE